MQPSKPSPKRYNPRKRNNQRKLNPMKLVWLFALITVAMTGLTGLPAQTANPAPSPWEQPTASLADEIAGILGPGQAHLTIRNLSSIPTDEIPAIRRLLEQDLKTHGVLASGADSANTIRVTLSENTRERLWVAEVIEGSETRVAMVHVEQGTTVSAQSSTGLTLRKQTMLTAREEILATLEIADGLVAVEPEQIVIYNHTADGWHERKRVSIGQTRPLARDPRGVIFPSAGGDGFEASVAGMACIGSYQPAQPTGEWTVHCHESDDPWTIVQPPVTQAGSATLGTVTQMNVSVTPFKAFSNAARNYFTGVVSPGLGFDLPPFYSATQIVRSTSSAPFLFGGIDGKVQIWDGPALKPGVPADGSSSVGLKPIAGTRDWGSDFAALNSGCGAGAQIVASSSGEAPTDSLRAYELPALEAIPASAPLAMDGTVTALWTAPDSKSIFAVVRNAADQYEVDRVTASCN
jgi:hypothetical protein